MKMSSEEEWQEGNKKRERKAGTVKGEGDKEVKKS